jgi:type IV pilus assembly protein PilE
MKTINRKNGFSLIELVVVLAVMGILLGIMIPVFTNAKQNESDVALTAYEDEVGKALLQYYIIYGTQISQTSDAGETAITDDNSDLTGWMTVLNEQFDTTFRGGYTYQYENKGPFGSVTIKEN